MNKNGKNGIKKIPLDLNKIINTKNSIIKINNDLLNTDNSESPKNIEINHVNNTQ